MRISRLLAACARDYDVTFVGPKPHDCKDPVLPPSVSKAVLFETSGIIPADPALFWKALRTGIGLPMGSSFVKRLRFLHALNDLDLNSFDVIWAERTEVGMFFSGQRERTVVDYDDITHRKLHRLLSIQKTSIRRLHTRYQVEIYRHAELKRFSGYNHIVVCSDEDRSYLERNGVGPVWVVPNGVSLNVTERAGTTRKPGKPLRAVFLGNMAHAPNMDALRYCAEEILPSSKSVVESMDVIGANVPPEVALKYQGIVNFRGFVDDIGEALRQYDVMLAPLRYGSGTKLKLLDAMAANLPIVTTDVGAEGLLLADGVSALIANSRTETLAALEQLANDPELGIEIAARARKLIDEHFLWSAVERDVANRLQSIEDK